MHRPALWLLPALLCSASLALAQGTDAPGEPPPADPAPPPEAPAPPPAAPAPSAAPAPPAPAPAPSGAQPAPAPAAQPEPAPGYGPPPGAYPAEPPPPDYSMMPPPPPPEKPDNGFEMPPWSLRVDPFNWLLEGRLGVEAEVGLLKWMSFEVVPVFVANDKPPTFNLSGSQGDLYQESNGIGSMSGASADLGFWLDGRALRGYVIRLGITNYGYRYYTKDDVGEIDSLKHTERRAFFMFGSHSKWGAFTIAGGIGLGVELNKEQRCFPDNSTSVAQAQTSSCDNQMLLALSRDTKDQLDLNGPLHPMYFMARFSLGLAFD